MFYDPEFAPSKLIVRYLVGGREHEAVVLANGHSLEDHVGRLTGLEELTDPEGMPVYATWPLAGGGAVAIRVNAIVALEGGATE